MALSSIAQKRLFILGSFVVLLLAVLLYWRIRLLIDTFAQIDHANQVELKLEHVATSLMEAETAQRGFLITRDSSFLKSFTLGIQNVNDDMLEAEKYIKHSPHQVQNLTALKSLIALRFSLMNATLVLGESPQATLNQYLSRGQVATARIREHLGRMVQAERKVLTQHEDQKEQYTRLTPISLLFLVFAMLIIIGFSYYGLTKQLQQTKKYATNLDYLNHELLLKNQQLENSVEELNAFNYIASHDLKEPLRKILFFTDMLMAREQQLSSEARDHLEKIQTAGGRMKSLLDDLLTYAKASMTEPQMEAVDLNKIVDAVVESLTELLKERGATVVYRDLPQVQAVPSQMQQLFENLMTNAVKYSRPNVPPHITITSSHIAKGELPPHYEAAHDWYYCIRFSDNGIGFPQENADRIFVLFQRLHQRHEFSGTGIGLTICKKVVQNHNGFITASSTVGEGSTFTVYLPAPIS